MGRVVTGLGLTICLVLLGLVGLGSFSAYFAWVHARASARIARGIRAELKRQSLVSSNSYTLLLNHFYRQRGQKPKDWADDAMKTHEPSGEHERALTSFDWTDPSKR